jgi:iron uptake system component EfeO
VPARFVVLSLCAALLGVAACSSSAKHVASPAVTTVEVSLSHCGRGWTSDTSGWHSFVIHDADSRAAEVSLVDPDSGAVYAAVEPLAAGRSAAMGVELAPGSYAFRCALEDESVVSGPRVLVTGRLPAIAPTAVPPVLPVTQQDLIGPSRAYAAYVTGRLPVLARDVDRIRSNLIRHDRRAAERDWLTAHLDYERLGAAYGAFGAADGAINGLPSGWPKGVRDSRFSGFHRVERDLWHGGSVAQVTREVTALAALVAKLTAGFAAAQVDPLEVSIRAHEITENALQLELTGRTDFGSHSTLATVRANLDGTRTVVSLLTPLLRPRYAALPAAIAALNRAEADLEGLRSGARWPALSALPRPARERVDSDFSELTELLAPIASICEPRRTT